MLVFAENEFMVRQGSTRSYPVYFNLYKTTVKASPAVRELYHHQVSSQQTYHSEMPVDGADILVQNMSQQWI